MRFLCAASVLYIATLLPPTYAGLFFGTTVCSKCVCTDADPYIIDCSDLDLSVTFTSSDTWPTNKSDIRLLYNGNSLVDVTPVPALDITELSYQKNSISSVKEGAFQELRRLMKLDLSHNKLARSSLNEHSFRGQFSPDDYQPSPIQSLDLSYNDIHSIFEETLSHLSSLAELDLSNNPLKLLDHHTVLAVTSLGELRALRMRNTGLLRLPRTFLHSLRHLETLDLAHNKLRVVPHELRYSHAIVSLCLDGNPIKTVDADSFRGMTRLETLNLSGMPLLQSIGDEAFSSLTALRVLRMRNNLRLHTISALIFRGMDTSRGLLPLKEFIISGNNLTTLSEATVPFWDQLLLLQLHDNPWRCDCKLMWMTTKLLPQLQDTDRHEAGVVLCQSPASLRGVPVLRAADRPGAMVCEQDPPRHHHQGTGGATLAVVLFAGGLVLVTGAAAVTYLIVRRDRIRRIYSPRLWAVSLVGTVVVLFVSVLFFWFVIAAAKSGPTVAGGPFLMRLAGSFLLFLLICGVASVYAVRRQTASAAYRAKQQIRYRRAAMEEEATVEADDVNPTVVIRS